MPYSKNGSIPSQETDGTPGWIWVPEAPEPPEGQEVVWWYPPGWVCRDPRPSDRDGYVWKWNQDQQCWVEYQKPLPAQPEEVLPDPTPPETLISDPEL